MTDADATVSGEKLQKVLAASGMGSRRQIETWISAGRVKVNGEPAHLGQRVTLKDRIEVDGQRVRVADNRTQEILIYNKPGGVVCSRRDPEGRPTIFDNLPERKGGRWVSVGRLDIQTSGLLLLTSDGQLANRLMHPSTGLDREYAVRVNVKLEEEALDALREGFEIDGEWMNFSDIRFYNGSENNFWYHVVLLEGKNREVRKLFAAVGCVVSRLKRVRYGPVVIPSWLRSGQWASLTVADTRQIYRMLQLKYSPPRHKKSHVPRNRIAKTSCLIPYPKLSSRLSPELSTRGSKRSAADTTRTGS